MATSLRTMKPRLSVPALVLISLAVAPPPSAAEPVAITSGFLQVHTRINEGFFTLEGDNFFFTGGFDGVFGSYGLACDFCAPGTPVELDSDFRMNQGHGSAVVNGTTYPSIWFDGMTVSFQTPTTLITGAESRLLIVPFTFEGLVQFFAIDPFLEPSDAIFSTSLAGTGRAIASFHYRADIDVFDANPEIRYEFGATADPVPEPATLLLCGFGTAALGMIRRRRRAVNP